MSFGLADKHPACPVGTLREVHGFSRASWDSKLGRVEKVYPPFGGMSTDARIRLLLADDTPKEIDSIFYRFLIQLFASRERGLASGPAGGRP